MFRTSVTVYQELYNEDTNLVPSEKIVTIESFKIFHTYSLNRDNKEEISK